MAAIMPPLMADRALLAWSLPPHPAASSSLGIDTGCQVWTLVFRFSSIETGI
ncbi:hypothetical protein [Collinsella sp. AF29-7AC]|uniref:hypothetical protein n=1 Tax=Collinsella sp. AF29-7AC TaxID=2292010 RepID=UPI001F1D4E38|nr:hypothetical protein [Collinsella sp. AF29-7AC]